VLNSMIIIDQLIFESREFFIGALDVSRVLSNSNDSIEIRWDVYSLFYVERVTARCRKNSEIFISIFAFVPTHFFSVVQKIHARAKYK